MALVVYVTTLRNASTNDQWTYLACDYDYDILPASRAVVFFHCSYIVYQHHLLCWPCLCCFKVMCQFVDMQMLIDFHIYICEIM